RGTPQRSAETARRARPAALPRPALRAHVIARHSRAAAEFRPVAESTALRRVGFVNAAAALRDAARARSRQRHARLLSARAALPVSAARISPLRSGSARRRPAVRLAPLPRQPRRPARARRPPALSALLPAHVSLADRRLVQHSLGALVRRRRRIPVWRHRRHH